MRISDWSSDVCSSDLRIIRERRVQRFAEGHRLGRDHMFQRTTLDAGEDRRIELLGQHHVLGQDQTAAPPAQRLVRFLCHAPAMFAMVWMRPTALTPAEMDRVPPQPPTYPPPSLPHPN